jgi:hypothetical protein
MEKLERDLLDWKNILGVVPYCPWQLYTFLPPTGVQALLASYIMWLHISSLLNMKISENMKFSFMI